MHSINKTFAYQEFIISGQKFTPAELIQIDTEKNLDIVLGLKPDQIKNVLVVGAWRGNEVTSFLKYPNAIIYCFEPNIENFNHLVDRWGNNKRVFCFNVACASFDGWSTLNEASLTGNDSLLSIKEDSYSGLKLIKTHKVKTVKLDSVKEIFDKDIDLLWADVQGYELEVLLGASELLKRTKALFLEVYRHNMDYQYGAKYEEVISFLDKKGFYPVAHGLDNNFGGNALFLENSIRSNAYEFESYEKRIKHSIKEASKRRKLLNFRIIQLLTTYTPVRIKTFIRRFISI